MLPGQGATQSIPKDAVRLSIVFGAFSADAMLLAELSQAGAIQPTGLTITDEVMLVARGQTVARGTLGIYQGRFAVTVN